MNDRRSILERLRVWLIAVRPFAYSASAMPLLLGLVLAYRAGFQIRWWHFALTLAGVLCFHTGANLLSDCYDFRRGLDTEPRPHSGAVVRGLLAGRQVFNAGVACFGLGVACGLYLVHVAGWVVLALGVIGTVLAFGYTGPFLRLKYVAPGDLTVLVCFGPLPVFGTFWVQTHTFRWPPILWSIPLAMHTVAVLHANNWRDSAADRNRGCRTVASIIGEWASLWYYRVLMLGPFVFALIAGVCGALPELSIGAPPTVLLSLIALVPVLSLVRAARETDAAGNDDGLQTLDSRTARVQLLFGVALVAGLFPAPLVSPAAE